jgi:hypothetical protein
MDRLANQMRIAAVRATQFDVSSAKGVVTSYDPNRYAAKVFIMPEGSFPDETGEIEESGWIPVNTSWSGNGWGMFCPPSPGDQVTIQFIEGDTTSAEIVGRVFDVAHLPLNVPSGEFWLVHASGTFLKLTNDGKVSLNSSAEIDVGNLVDAVQTLCTQAFHDWAEGHVHGGVTRGSSTTDVPTTSPPADSLTAVLKAN